MLKAVIVGSLALALLWTIFGAASGNGEFCTLQGSDNEGPCSKREMMRKDTLPWKTLELVLKWTLYNRYYLYPVLLFLCICALSLYLLYWGRQARVLKNCVNAFRLPILGSLFYFFWIPEVILSFKTMTLADYLQKHLGRRFVFWIGHNPMLFVMEAEGAQKILSSTKWIEKGDTYDAFRWLLGNGLISSNGEMWRNDRKLLSPSFKYQKFDGFLSVFNKHSHTLLRVLKEQENQPFPLHTFFSKATIDFIVESALGQESTVLSEENSEFFKAVHKSFQIIRTHVLRPWTKNPKVSKLLGVKKDIEYCNNVFHPLTFDVVNKRRKLLEENLEEKSETKPFIDCLFETKSDTDIMWHIKTIYGAGFETTASGMTYTMFCLANDQEALKRVHQELDAVLGDAPEVTFEHLAELKYLEMCVKESLRLFPPAPVILRKAQSDIPFVEDEVIAKGTEIAFLIYHLHRDPKYFPDPEKFDPDRFQLDECTKRHPFAYIPFSAGPRNCLGLKYAMVQMKTCLAHVLRRYHVTTTMRREDLELTYGIVLETSKPIPFTLTPRNV